MKYLNLYFTFFDNTVSKNLILEPNAIVKTNLEKCKVSFFLVEIQNRYRDEITSFELMIEKESEGNFIFNNKIIGNLADGLIEFDKCELKDSNGMETKYRLYVDCKQGGLTIFTTKDQPVYIQLKTSNSDFNLIVHDAIELNEIFELQQQTEELKFDLSIKKTTGVFTYSFYLDSDSTGKKPSDGEFIPISSNFVELKTELSSSYFKNNITYLHFYLKDNFGNIGYRKIPITTKNNVMIALSILNPEIQILNWKEEFGVLYESRNVEKLKPVIAYMTESGIVQIDGKKEIGTYDKGHKSFLFQLSEYFDEIQKDEFVLFFVLNGDKKLVSNEMKISIDNAKPSVEITNIENSYKLITDKNTTKFKLKGKVIDKNFFFLGSNVKKLQLNSNVNLLVLESQEELKEVHFGSEVQPLIKFNKYYYCKTLGKDFVVKDFNNSTTTNFKFVNDYTDEGEKSFYIWFSKKELTMYENNIIKHQGGLKLKGSILSFVTSQRFIEISDFYILQIIMRNDAKGTYSFDLGIADFDYSFLYRVLPKNISCEINPKKQIICDFEKTKIIMIKNFIETAVTKFNENKIISQKTGATDNLVNFLAISLKAGEFFTPNSNYIFFDDHLNSQDPETVYYKPVLKKGNNIIFYHNYICKKISDALYNFEMDIDIEDGENNFSILFEDILKNKIEKEFLVEKNYNGIKAIIDTGKLGKFNVKDNAIVTNRDSVVIQFLIINETKKLKTKDKIIRIKSDKTVKQQIIQDDESEKRIVIFEFNATPEEVMYEIYYEETSTKIGHFTLQKKNQLLLSSNKDKFISGSNHYFLTLDKDEFSKLSVVHNNQNTFSCSVKDNVIDISRNNNVNIMEDIELELTVFDPSGLFNSISKTIQGTFYNDNIIESYKILGDHIDHKIKEHSFSVEIKTNKSDYIEYIRAYDKTEINFYKRFKYGKKEENVYTIQNITTPLKPSPIEIEIKLKKMDFTIKKHLFENDPVLYVEEKHNLLCSFAKNNDKLEISLKNQYKKEVVTYNKMEIFHNGVKFHTSNGITITNLLKLEFDKKLFSNSEEILVVLYDKKDKIVFTASEVISFDEYIENSAKLKNFETYNIKTQRELSNVILELKKKDEYFYSLNIIDIYGNTSIVNLEKDSTNEIDISEGTYTFELYAKKFNTNKLIHRYYVVVANDIESYFTFSTEYTMIRYIDEIRVDVLLPIYPGHLDNVLIFKNSEVSKNIYPYKIEGKKIFFKIPKMNGTNEYIYKNQYVEKVLPECIISPRKDKNFKIKNLYTTDNVLLFQNDDEVILQKKTNLFLYVENCESIHIISKGLRQKIHVTPNQRTMIHENLIPCTLEFYKKGWKIKTMEINVERLEDELIPVDENKEIQKLESIPFELRMMQMKRQEYQIKMKNRTKHFLLDFANMYAGVKWKSMSIDYKEEFLSNVAAEVFEEINELNLNKIKERIIKRLGEFE